MAAFVATEQLLDCVHCGLCHSACPTYVELGTEADSPRGRIHLMRALQEETLALDDAIVGHLDLCLGCRGCETACPSGVRYGALIEAARPWIEARHRRPATVRLRRWVTLGVLPFRARLAVLLAPLRLLERLGVLGSVRDMAGRRFPSLRYVLGLVPSSLARVVLPERVPAYGTPRHTACLLVGCVMPELFGTTVQNTVEVLRQVGVTVLVPRRQGCCGALSLHAGDRETARRLARANIEAFETSDPQAPVVVNAAGCGACMREYGELLADDHRYAARARRLAARVRDVTELVASLPLPPLPSSSVSRRVAYHDPCHLAHAQGIRDAPRRLVAAIPGCTLVPMEDEDLCCGSAGHYNVMQPAMARRLVARKVAAIRASGADVVATANAGCALQLEAGLRAEGVEIPVRHVVDLLAEAYRRG